MLRPLAAQRQVGALIRLVCSGREGAGRQSAGPLECRAGFKAASLSYWGNAMALCQGCLLSLRQDCSNEKISVVLTMQ